MMTGTLVVVPAVAGVIWMLVVSASPSSWGGDRIGDRGGERFWIVYPMDAGPSSIRRFLYSSHDGSVP